MRRICFVTATRAEYGLLKWLMKEVKSVEEFCLQIVATGAHLLKEQGLTVDTIREDGFAIDEIVDAQLDTSSTEMIAESMGRMAQLFSHVFKRLSPDFVVVLGDRYELLPIVNTAFVMRIPIIHLSGGDVTEGAIDDGIRNAVTMLSDYHFPGTIDSARNIIRMRGSEKKVWVVGEPGLDSFNREQLMTREELSDSLGLALEKKWVLFTYHAETKESIERNIETVKKCISCLLEKDLGIVATYSNADYGGKSINECLEKASAVHPENVRVIPSLGNKRYLSLMKQVALVIGNSSSGIVEAPVIGIPVVNIGNRQSGRHLCGNIIQTDDSEKCIRKSIETALRHKKYETDYYWGDGHTAEKIIGIIKKELL